MRTRYKVAIVVGPISVAMIFLTLIWAGVAVYILNPITSFQTEQESIPVEIVGTIEYIITREGEEYQFTPLDTELNKLAETGYIKANLEGPDLVPELDGKKVKIQGKIKKMNGEYITHLFSGLPEISVKKIEILN